MDNRIIIREYLENLKEDKELDAIFPLLLIAKGFRLLSIPAQSKGQSQYGKDVVAIGKDGGTIYRYYFELKAGKDRHIDQQTFFNNDGISMSLKEAKYTPYIDVGVASYSNLPIKYVLAHTGVTKENFKPTFAGFITEEFPDGNFEQWNIDRLTEEFDNHLFNEYLIPNQEDSSLFRKVLLLIDTPDYNQSDFKRLVEKLINRMPAPKEKRKFKSAWATLTLLGQIVWHRCRQSKNLHPAIDALTFLMLSSWAYVLHNKFEKKGIVIIELKRIVKLHFDFLREYFKKTAKTAALPEGLFVEGSGPFEAIGYPLRSFEYLGLLIYYFEASHWYQTFNKTPNKVFKAKLEYFHKRYLRQLIEANTACHRPILDAHNIPILATVLYMLKCEKITTQDGDFIANYIFQNIESILIINKLCKRFPSISQNLQPLIEFAATGDRPFNYLDSSSLLIPILMEFTSFFDLEKLWNIVQPILDPLDVNMQIAHPNVREFDIEQLLFENQLDSEYYVETGIKFPVTCSDYYAGIKLKTENLIQYRTEKAGFPFLLTLAHIYYKSEFFPDDWRSIFTKLDAMG